ncbi:MAG: flagellar filament capping protein FliD, partial [Mariprofundus sp.]|nr:flagellar filament capping protein FliD [Mariprofundus sp.]
SNTYSVLDPATDTISGLLSAIQSAFNQEVSATIDTNGNITLTDISTGDSQLTVGLTANNESSGSTLAFGSDTVITEGRYALPVQAVISGTGIAIEAASYGASSGFSITQDVDGLGIANTSVAGTDVIGAINGLAATGAGQILRGTTGDVDGLALLYAGSTTGVVGDLTVGIGIAASLDGLLDLYANPVVGLIQSSIFQDQGTFDDLTAKIEDLTRLMEQQRATLSSQFNAMQNAMASLSQSSAFLSQASGLASARN